MKLLFISEFKQDLDMISRVIKNQYKDIEIVLATSKEEALSYVSVDGPFGFYGLDSEAKNFEPDELGKELLDFTGDRPIIFLGHEAFITDRISQELYNANEYNERLLRPFDRVDFKDDLTNKINNALVFAKKEQFENSIEDVDPLDFIPMKIKSFYLFKSFPYDIYMEITPTRYIKILEAEKPYTISTLATYAKKNIRVLHIKKDDQLEYLETEAKKCLKAMRKLNVKSDQMMLVLLRSVTLAHQTLITVGVTPLVLTLTSAITDIIIEIVANSRNSIGPILERYPTDYAGIASKSLLSGLVSVALAAKMGWDSITTKKKLSMASLLMDFTLMDEDMSSINSPADPRLKKYNEDELENFFQHPIKAAEISQQFTMYPDIDFLIENHHETPTRRGFPNQPSQTRLNALCSVFNIGQFIAAEIDGRPASNQLLGKTLRALTRDYNTGNFKEAAKGAKELLKM